MAGNNALIGHVRETKWLRKALVKGRVFLLLGPEGVGKRAIVEKLVSELLGVEQDALATHSEVLIVEPQGASNSVTVEQARGIRRFLSLTPAIGTTKIVILDGAERLRAESANALLKTLEEPPSYAIVFLLTSAEGAVLPTIRSRSLKLRLRALSDDILLKDLMGQGFGKHVIEEVLPLAQGRPGHAISLLLDAKARSTADRLSKLAEKLLFAERFTRLATLQKLEREHKDMLSKLPELWMSPIRQRLLMNSHLNEQKELIGFLRECERATDAVRNSALNTGLLLEGIMMRMPIPKNFKAQMSNEY